MKYTIIIVTGFFLLSILGCSSHKEIELKKSQILAKKPPSKKSKVKKISSKVKAKQSYKSVIDKNIAMSKEKKKKLALLKAKKEMLLQEMKSLQTNYSQSKDQTLLQKKREKIIQEINRIDKEYKALEAKVVVVNYRDKESKE